MKIYFYQKKLNNITTYTYELLKYIAIKYGHQIVDTAIDADITAISLSSCSEIDTLRVFRNKNKKCKIIVGGQICNSPGAVLRYADYLNLGQGYEFFEKCKNISDIDKQEFIVTKEKKAGIFSHYINWDLIPLIQIAKNSYSILYSVGCRRKCNFCLTSHINKYQVNPNKNKIYIARKIIKNKQLYLICNDFDGKVKIKRKVSDVRVKKYIENPNFYNGIQLLRLGIESPFSETRKKLGKYIDDDELKELFKITKAKKQRINLFFIAGLDVNEQWEKMVNLFENDITNIPRIGIIINYFDSQVLTPMSDYDMTTIQEINIPKIKRIWKIKNGRIVVFHDLKIAPYNAIYTSMLSRCDSIQVDEILNMKKEKKYNNLESFYNDSENRGLFPLINGSYKNEYKLMV